MGKLLLNLGCCKKIRNFKQIIETVLDLLKKFKKDTDDYELYDPRIHSLRGNNQDESFHSSSMKRGPILVNRPPKNTKPKQEVGKFNKLIKDEILHG